MVNSSIYVGGQGLGNHPSTTLGTDSDGVSLNSYLTSVGVKQDRSRKDTYGGGKTITGEMESFNRYGVLYADDEMSSSLGYVFMVRPDLNLFTDARTLSLRDQAKTDLFISFMNYMDPTILLNLTQDTTGDYYHQFMPMLYDRVDEYQIPNIDLAVHEMTQPFSGFKTVYAGNSNGSQSGCQFEIGFRETADLRITKLFQAWIAYINGITLNFFAPKEKYLYSKYTEGSQVIDYATSIYFVRTRPDGEIIYFHKVTGAFPTQVPLSQQSFNRGGQPDNKITVSFTGGYPESLNPVTMTEFNVNALGITEDRPWSTPTLAPDYDVEGFGGNGFSGDLFTGAPLIVRYVPKSNRHGQKFYLCWQKYSEYHTGTEFTANSIPDYIPPKATNKYENARIARARIRQISYHAQLAQQRVQAALEQQRRLQMKMDALRAKQEAAARARREVPFPSARSTADYMRQYFERT